MKRTLGLLTAAFLLLSCFFGGSAFAAESCALSATAGAVSEGKVTVTVSMDQNPGITAIAFSLNYDSAKLLVESSSAGDALMGAVVGPNGDSYMWSSPSASTATGTLLSVTFQVQGDNWSTASVSIVVGDEDIAAADGLSFLGASVSDATVNKPHTCVATGDWLYDGMEHWKACSNPECSEKLEKANHEFKPENMSITKEATVSEHGSFDVKCSSCDYALRDNVLHGGIIEDPLGYDENQHWAVCIVSGCDYKINPESHSWDNGSVTTEPTAEQEGEKTFSCTVDNCGATRTEPVPATGNGEGGNTGNGEGGNGGSGNGGDFDIGDIILPGFGGGSNVVDPGLDSVIDELLALQDRPIASASTASAPAAKPGLGLPQTGSVSMLGFAAILSGLGALVIGKKR